MSDLVGYPEDQFSHIAAHLILNPLECFACAHGVLVLKKDKR